MCFVNVVRSELNRKIAHHLVFIINQARHEIGTGLLLQIGETPFVVTAAHVLRDATDDEVYLNMGIERQQFQFTFVDRWEDPAPNADIAYIRLVPFEVQVMRDGIEPFPAHARTTNLDTGRLRNTIFCGYPRNQWNRERDYVQALSFTLVLNLPLLPTDWPQDVAQTADPNSNFAISFHPDKTGGALVDQDGNPAQAFDPHGMSGAPVWLFDRDTLEDDNPYYAFFGIYTGFYGTSQCFKGTKLDALLDQISAHTGLEIPQT